MKIVVNIFRVILLVVTLFLLFALVLCIVHYFWNGEDRINGPLIKEMLITLGISAALWFVIDLVYKTIENLV